MFTKTLNRLPIKIQDTLTNSKLVDSFICSIKTSFKPNATIPILWIVISNNKFILCNTHKTRGITSVYNFDEINCIKDIKSSGNIHSIKVIFNDLDTEDLVLPLSDKLSNDEILIFLSECSKLNIIH